MHFIKHSLQFMCRSEYKYRITSHHIHIATMWQILDTLTQNAHPHLIDNGCNWDLSRSMLTYAEHSLFTLRSLTFVWISLPQKKPREKLLSNELSASNANNNQHEQWFVINVSEHRPSNEPLHEINRTICHLNNEFVAHGEKFQYLQFGRCAKQKKSTTWIYWYSHTVWIPCFRLAIWFDS